ncbi:MAG: ligand-binding protein SH3 [Deltaproteobacteria bacterium]|nr:ligand-binding protein SH3 [Deltaproteobacteria bacterium]
MLNNRITAVIFVLLMVFTLLLPKLAFAVENEPLDEIISGFDDKKPGAPADAMQDVLEGFDDDTKEVKPEFTKDEIKPSIFSLNGDVEFGASYNFAHDKPEGSETDWRGLSRLRTELNLELNARFSSSWQARISGKGAYDFAYAIRGRDEFTNEVIDNYEKELELGETYLQGNLTKSLDIKLGHQIVVWGKSDNIRVTDVLNPLDMREPGLTDIEDLRLPVTMTRLDYYIGDWSLTGIAIHEIRFNKIPEYGSDFYPGSQPPPHEDKPDSCYRNTEYAAAINGIFSGWDISFYWADYYNDMPHTQFVSAGPPPQTGWKHARLKMFGVAFNQALGNWLLKAETAYIDGFEFFSPPGREYSRTDVLAGTEYSGFKDTTLSIEAVNRHINDFDEALKLPPDNAREDEFQWVVRLTRDFLNDTLTLTLLASTYGATGQDGALQRFSAEYDVTDSIQITGGVVLYKSGDLARYKNIGDNDRLFCEIKYSF